MPLDRTKYPYVGMVDDLDGKGWKVRNPEWIARWAKDAVIPPAEILSTFCPRYSYSQKVKIKDGRNTVDVQVLYVWLDYYSNDIKNAQYDSVRKPEYKMVYYGKKATGHNIGFTDDDVIS